MNEMRNKINIFLSFFVFSKQLVLCPEQLLILKIKLLYPLLFMDFSMGQKSDIQTGFFVSLISLIIVQSIEFTFNSGV